MLAKKPSATAANIKILNIFKTPTTLLSVINFMGTKIRTQKNLYKYNLVYKFFKYYHKIIKYVEKQN